MGDWWWVAGVAVPLLTAIFAVDFYIHRESDALRDEKDREVAELHTRVNACNKELWDYKVYAAQLFATVSSMSQVRLELMGSLNRIEDKLDKLSERSQRRDAG